MQTGGGTWGKDIDTKDSRTYAGGPYPTREEAVESAIQCASKQGQLDEIEDEIGKNGFKTMARRIVSSQCARSFRRVWCHEVPDAPTPAAQRCR